MDNYTKYLILSHLLCSEKGMTEEEIYNAYQEIKDKDIFSSVDMAGRPAAGRVRPPARGCARGRYRSTRRRVRSPGRPGRSEIKPGRAG